MTDYEKYENREQLAELERQIKIIDPTLDVSGVHAEDNRVVTVYLTLRGTGKDEILEKLLGIGFVRGLRMRLPTPVVGLVKDLRRG